MLMFCGEDATCLNFASLGCTLRSLSWIELARFVINVRLVGKAGGCDGYVRTADGTIIALFFGPLHNSGWDYAELVAMKIAVDVLIEAGWAVDLFRSGSSIDGGKVAGLLAGDGLVLILITSSGGRVICLFLLRSVSCILVSLRCEYSFLRIGLGGCNEACI
ncbi:hypothetical protein V6N11_068343 [Hibiscus sabdariffa]|uniref:RNase H type-1 domain-containing protein n=1 Tax=Hibiscus sabdariffa TaxID=183260 RepID=A0ABR1ZCE4_9ROSI